MFANVAPKQRVPGNLCGAIRVVQHRFFNPCGATCEAQWTLTSSRVTMPHARANNPHTHLKVGLKNPCGGECDGCLALAGASLRPR
eukprot:1177944-Pyramimonas_sp.AAC.1